MLWSTHIRIAHEVLRNLGIPKNSQEAMSLREGIITPDNWRDFPHHHNKEKEIREHLLEARRLFLEDDLINACFHLGVALHYIQDSYTSLTSRSEHHTRWEEQMDQAYFTNNLSQLVENAFHDRPDRFKEYQAYAEMLSQSIEGKESTLNVATMPGPGFTFWGRDWGKPHVDVNFALKASNLISKAVFARKDSLKLQKDLDITRSICEKKLQETESFFTNRIVELIRKRDDLVKEKTKGGTFQILRNWFLTFSSKIQEFRAKRKFGKYLQQKHLQDVLSKYRKNVKSLVAPHYLWYTYNIPPIELDVVKKELLKLSEAIEHMRIKENVFRELIDRKKISCYRLDGRELIRRTEITQEFTPPNDNQTTAERIRKHVQTRYLEPARQRKETHITVRAGDIHDEMGLSHRQPLVCDILRGKKFQRQCDVKLVDERWGRNVTQKHAKNIWYTYEV